MTKSKSHLPENYLLTDEEKQNLRDWALEGLARIEELTGRPVRLARHSGQPQFASATEAWEARKRERDRGRTPK